MEISILYGGRGAKLFKDVVPELTAGGRESLKNIKDTKLRREVQQGIAKFHARIGVRERNVMMADLAGGVHGMQATRIVDGQNVGIDLSKSMFKNGTVKSVSAEAQRGYKKGWFESTNKPVQHVVVHEMSHALWNTAHLDAKGVAAGRQIQTQYKAYLKSFGKTKAGQGIKTTTGRRIGGGTYSRTNVNEFFAEKLTKGIIGKGDAWSRKLLKIVNKYDLGRR